MEDMRNVLLLLFAIGGMLAAWQGGRQISSIFGFGAGIMNAIQGRELMSIARLATGGVAGVGKLANFGAKAAGFKGGFGSKGKKLRVNSNGGGNSSGGNSAMASASYQKPLTRQGLGAV